MYTTQQVMELSGATYRQLDHWTRKGWVKPTGQGTGNDRDWSWQEKHVAKLMIRLINGGFQPATAADIARRLVGCAAGATTVTMTLTEGLELQVSGI